MRPLWRWIVHGRPKPTPPIVLEGDWKFEDPRTDALVAIAAAMEAQTELLQTQAAAMERYAVAAESVAAALDRAEKRVLEAETAQQLNAVHEPC